MLKSDFAPQSVHATLNDNILSSYRKILLTFVAAYAILHLVKDCANERGRCDVSISYNRLWKLMIDHNMNKTQLRKEAGLSTNVIAKLSKNDSVSMDTLLRICKALHCDVGDIMEVSHDYDCVAENSAIYGGQTDE
jgi:DNA (cytosine-5)-methyltransferase 1